MGDIMSKVVSTLITVVIAVGASAAIWIGANLMFNQVRKSWSRFSLIAYAVTGFVIGVLLSGNRITRGSTGGDDGLAEFASWVWLPLVAAAAAAVIGLVLSTLEAPTSRLLVGVGGLGALGLAAGLLVRPEYRPELAIGPLIGWTVGVAAVGAGIMMLLKRPPIGGALFGAALGWILGAWGAPDLGDGSAAWAAIAAAVPAALVGARLGLAPIPTQTERNELDQRSRAVVFLGPAVLFVFAMLVVPTVRTIYLSFLDRDSEDFVGFENYTTIFQDDRSIDLSGWADTFGSRLFWIAAILLVVFLVLGLREKKLTGKVTELGAPSSGPLIVGILMLAFAVFTALRGTIINNLWWVVVVTFFSTGLGLAIAVLADGARLEKVAKSIIFMPMAVSLVGASVIWRFMYVARDTSQPQTGVMNALWVELGLLSTGDGLPTYIIGGVLTVIFLAVLALVATRLTRQAYGKVVLPAVVALLLGWFLIRYWAIIGTGVGGHRVDDETGEVIGAQAINFIQEGPYNNFWLMVVLIWIQTGFAMVILSAAIKAVPTEFIEAARVDGATDSQIFWRITLPQIATTIGVVVTTLIVLVMKVYDIVKVMTNGNFGTEVLANNMFREAFTNSNRGLGAALAALIFVSVLPIMYMNIRRMQEEN